MASPHQQKLRIDGPVIVTANGLAAGAPLYWTAGGTWSASLDEAAVTIEAEVAQGWLDAARQDYCTAVGAYIARVSPDAAGTPQPLSVRETIRSRGGPSFLPAASERVADVSL